MTKKEVTKCFFDEMTSKQNGIETKSQVNEMVSWGSNSNQIKWQADKIAFELKWKHEML